METATRKKKTLPEELVYDILLNLPVKSLLRCRCVCKSWYNLIKNPNFIKSHLIKNQNQDPDYLILIRGKFDLFRTLSFLDYNSLGVIAPNLDVPVPLISHVDVCGPCNGLICISDSLNNLVLCNPSLREFRKIPSLQFTFPEGYYVRLGRQYVGIGLGFDSNRNDYKIVSFIRISSSKEFTSSKLDKILCLVYSVGMNTWRGIEHEQSLDMSYKEPILSPGFLFNGALHWIAQGRDISSDKKSTLILRFDLNTEVFRCIKLPNFDHERNIDISLVAFNDSLAFFAYDWEEEQLVELWVLKQYGVDESWKKQFSVEPMMNPVLPLYFRKNKILVSVWKNNKDRLVSRSLDSDEKDDYEIDGYEDTYGVLVNQESLVSIK